MDTAKIIEKWYKALDFPPVYDAEFYKALSQIKIDDVEIDNYDTEEKDGRKNFLSYLYMCEKLSKQYKLKGIPEEILYDTLSDLGRWLNTFSEMNGGLYLGELYWLKQHLSMKLFKLGRLQYSFGTAKFDIAGKGIKKGDNVIEVHIPADGVLIEEECKKSFNMARKFFKEFYPDYKCKYFTCHSWLMDESLKHVLKPDSNILKFQNMFEVFEPEESYAILKYVFKWNTTKENLNSYTDSSSLAKAVKDWVNNGKKFHEALGVIEIEN